MMSEPVAIPFNPAIPFHGDVKSFAMLGPRLQVGHNDMIDADSIPHPAKAE
jgi:hypothetical protein